MSNTYLALLRGINVGGKNKLPMADLRACLEGLGYENVQTYIASGNVLFDSDKSAAELAREIEAILPKTFTLDSQLVSILILSHDGLKKVVGQAPQGFGAEPTVYHSDIIFLIGVSPDEAFKVFNPREGVDKVWRGELAIYSQRLSEQRTKSRLSKVMSSPLYKRMTIRTWNTVTKLLALMDSRAQK